MPEFSNAFSGRASERPLTHNELVRAVRFMIAAEFEAIQLYEQLAESTVDTRACKVLRDIAREEMEHVGEFRRLLRELAPYDEPAYYDGVREAEKHLAEWTETVETCCADAVAYSEDCCQKQPPVS